MYLLQELVSRQIYLRIHGIGSSYIFPMFQYCINILCSEADVLSVNSRCVYVFTPNTRRCMNAFLRRHNMIKLPKICVG